MVKLYFDTFKKYDYQKYDDNLTIIKRQINQIRVILYGLVNEYLENILNSPSTINRVIKYYKIAFNVINPSISVFFKYTLIKEFKLTLESDLYE